MLQILLALDANILLWIQDYLRNPVLDPVMKVITSLNNYGIIWIAIIVIMLCFKKTRKTGILCACALLLELLMNDCFIKPLVARVRPYDAVEGLTRIIEKQKDYSFPSGHTASSFACAFIICRTQPKKYGIASVVFASLIAFSRLYVGVHYPSDVIGGILLGIAAGLIVYGVYSLIVKKRKKKESRTI